MQLKLMIKFHIYETFPKMSRNYCLRQRSKSLGGETSEFKLSQERHVIGGIILQTSRSYSQVDTGHRRVTIQCSSYGIVQSL